MHDVLWHLCRFGARGFRGAAAHADDICTGAHMQTWLGGPTAVFGTKDDKLVLLDVDTLRVQKVVTLPPSSQPGARDPHEIPVRWLWNPAPDCLSLRVISAALLATASWCILSVIREECVSASACAHEL